MRPIQTELYYRDLSDVNLLLSVKIFVCCMCIPLLLLQSPSIDRYLFALQSVGQAALVSLFKRHPFLHFQQK